MIKKYVPEGWEIDYNKSTSYVKYLRNKDLDVEVEVHVNASIDTDMYNYDRKEQKTCWNIGNSGNIKYVYMIKPNKESKTFVKDVLAFFYERTLLWEEEFKSYNSWAKSLFANYEEPITKTNSLIPSFIISSIFFESNTFFL